MQYFASCRLTAELHEQGAASCCNTSHTLTVTHAGYPQYELLEGGSDIIVDTHNVGQYIDAVVNATMHEGIAAQMQGFRCAPHTL